METVMCLSCGNFVPGAVTDGAIEPLVPACPECGGTSFKHNASGRVVELD